MPYEYKAETSTNRYCTITNVIRGKEIFLMNKYLKMLLWRKPILTSTLDPLSLKIMGVHLQLVHDRDFKTS